MKTYNIALDIGTNSVGYAAIDEYGRLLRYHKRPMYGSVLFDGAKTAEIRRMHRSTRRRLERKKSRIKLLQNLTAPDVYAEDPNFFHRLNESFLLPEDCIHDKLYLNLPKTLFIDGSVSVGSFRADAPTIYHVRKALVESDRQADIRYVYLAMHHILKYRGNFLMEGQPLPDANAKPTESVHRLLDMLNALNGLNYSFQAAPAEEICDILASSSPRSDRVKEIAALLHGQRAAAKDAAKALASLLLGYVGSLKILLQVEDQTIEKVSFSDPDFDESAYLCAMTEDQAEIFSTILALYRWQKFSKFCKDGKTLSDMMVAYYEQHGQNLRALKAWVRAYAPDQFDNLFRNDECSCGYAAYTGHLRKRTKLNKKVFQRCTQEDFYKAVKSVLQSNGSAEAVQAAQPMLAAMEEPNGFLPLQRINLNGQLPNQMQAAELAKILEHQEKFYPSLHENAKKILSICTFRLPYYVGPLNDQSSFQKWLDRDKSQKAFPWNFFEVVHQTETAMGFIKNLTNHCTYLPAEDILPLHSLLYEEYLVLDELNRVCVKDHHICAKLKQRILNELFAKRKSVSCKEFARWLQRNTPYPNITEYDISGTHEEGKFTTSLRTRFDLESHGFAVNEQTMPMLEELVRWSTIFENRGILRKIIEEKYPQVTPEQLNFLVQRRYTGWGRLSRKLLNGILGEYQNEPATVMDILRAGNDNLTQVLHKKEYLFQKCIAEINAAEIAGDIAYDEVDVLPCSPALRRGIWVSVRIVRELVQHMQAHGSYQLRSIYLENTREELPDDLKQKTASRLHKVEQLYNAIPESVSEECRIFLKECQDEKRMTDRQYLYLLQLGKSLYSQRPLDFDHLDATTQIDHILPQCYIKDDSIDNRALVLPDENQRKADSLVLDDSIRNGQKDWWVYLHRKGLISDKKLKNLQRCSVEPDDRYGFIARQLVETSQIIQHVTDLFKAHYPNVHVRGIKASLSSELRAQYHLYKIRALNNMHHAYDAFLAATLGNFAARFMPWLDDESSNAIKRQKLNQLYGEKIDADAQHGMILSAFCRDQADSETGEILRTARKDIAYLKEVLGYHDGHVVYLKREKTGALFDETRFRAKEGTQSNSKAKIPFKKTLDTSKYGGFSSIYPAYIAAISYQKGSKRTGALVNVPIFLADAIEKDPQALAAYLEHDYPKVHIIRPKILMNQRIEYEGSELLLRSCSEMYNARELLLPSEYHSLLYRIYSAPWRLTDADKPQTDALMELLFDKLRRHYPIFSGVLKRLEDRKSAIMALCLQDKCKWIAETIKVMSVGNQFGMYDSMLPKALGLHNNQGRITNKSLDVNHIILIDQSITGLYEKRTKLWQDSERS